MVKFVILEDNRLHLDKTEEIVLKYMMKNDYEFDILKFLKPSEEFYLLSEDDCNYIYILDFELIVVNAIDVARRIRKSDWISPIIIFTVNEGMAYETFKQRLQILDFVSKRKDARKNLWELFDICFEQLNVRNSLKYKIGKINYSIDYNKILYIYKDTIERKCVIVTDKNEYIVPMSLVQIKKMLPHNFLYSHKSSIVNINRVDALDWCKSTIIFDNNVKSNFLSRNYREELTK